MTVSAIQRWFRTPLCLLAMAAGLLAFAVQSGELGTSDTAHRLQTAHSFWTHEPPVYPEEFPEFGVHGRDGKLQTWYGLGQSLILLPSDILGTYLGRLPIFADYTDDATDPTVRAIVVSYSVNVLINVLTALICSRFLCQLQWPIDEAVAGVLALLIATTHLHYTQNMMENNYIFLLTLTGFSYQYAWWRSGSRRTLLLGCGAFGVNLLTRLTTGLDLLAGALFLLILARLEGVSGRRLWLKCRTYVATAIPVYLLFGFIDRWYQYHRFGSFFSNYMSISSREQRLRVPGLPANYPFSTPFHAGFLGPLFLPEKSIFLFDPLLLLMLGLCLLAWKRFSAVVKAYIFATGLLLLAYISFYARFASWAGDSAWGDRYVSTTVELAVLLAVPLLLRHRRQLPKAVWIAGLAILAVSTVIQLASLAFWLPLELYQMETLGHPTFVVALRLKNIVAFALNRMNAWGLNNHPMTEDPWDYVHITTWNFLPFVLRRVGVAPPWVVNLVLAVWTAVLAAFAATLLRLRAVLISSGHD